MTLSLKKSYRPDIDGLRAVAIISVLIFHYFPSYIPGGFTGVDIFFVISGFLITRILEKEINHNRFSILNFYKRRVLRIFPALMTVFLVFLVFGWGVLFQSEFKSLGKHVLAGVFFISNFILKKEISYFDTLAELKPFLHLWSLAIEEQFYIVWPALFWFLRKKTQKVPLFVFYLVLAFFLYNMIESYRSPSKFFYSPLARAWQLGAGAMVFFIWKEWGEKFSTASLDLISSVGALLIGVGFFFLNDKMVYPGYWALVPTVGASFIIFGGGGALFNRYILSRSSLVGIGLISYPLYLWHWPLLSFSKIISPEDTTNLRKVCLLIASFVLAFLTYKFIERPLRFGTHISQKIKGLVIASLCIGLIGALVYKGCVPSYNKEDPKIYTEDWDHQADAKKVKFKNRSFQKYQSDLSESVVFLGDSHIEQYAPRIKDLINKNPKKNMSALFITGGGCPPFPNVVDKKGHPGCISLVDHATSFIKKDPHIKKICIGASSGYFTSGSFFYQDKKGDIPMDKGGRQKAINDLVDLVNFYKNDLKKEVIFLLDIPAHRKFDPVLHVDRENFFMNSLGKRTIHIKKRDPPLKDDILKQQKVFRDSLGIVAKKTGVEIIDPIKFLCEKERCPIYRKEAFIYKDNNHLAASFVKNNASFIDKIIKKTDRG